jgi:hypothetical protein
LPKELPQEGGFDQGEMHAASGGINSSGADVTMKTVEFLFELIYSPA